ncbi:MAG: MFS transporter [Patescibacteria group bacterium]
MHPRLVLSFANFFGAAHFFLIVFVVAPYLALLMPAERTGLVISLGAVITLSVFPFMPRLVRIYGARRLAIVLAFFQAVSIFVLTLSPTVVFAVLCIALACATSPLIAYQLDLLLEAATSDEGSTGQIRTLFISSGSLALILAPLMIGFLLGGTGEYSRVFLAASLSLTPFIVLLLFERLREGEPPHLSKIQDTFLCLWSNPDLRAASLGNGVLQFFFHLAPLYIPLYLHTVLGFPWSDLGWIFAVMLLPFVLIEYPAGYLADRWLGDKELLIAGFIITGIAFAAIAFVTAATPLLVIAAILFVSRIGAALSEAMVEGHFFRRVSERDANTISVFRMMRPVGALIAPLFASLLLLTGNYVLFFIVSGALIVAAGILVTIPLKDIR